MSDAPIERPILFDAGSVRWLLAGRKTQTRRVVKPQPQESYTENFAAHTRNSYGWAWRRRDCLFTCPSHQMITRCPHGVPGDRLWVRETWGAVWPSYDQVSLKECHIEYRADLPLGCTDYPGQWPAEEAQGNPEAPHWRASIHMPRWASRITLEVTGVRVERVQDISEGDCYAEGIERVECQDCDALILLHRSGEGHNEDPTEDYAAYWNALNAKRGHSWESNPWVWVIEVKVLEAIASKAIRSSL